MNLFIFGALLPIWTIFAADLICLFHSQSRYAIAPPNKQKDFVNFLSNLLPISAVGTPPAYFNPIRSQPTPDDPMLRASAEGRNPKMRKPGMSRVKSLVSHSHTRL
jgi:hypothetical protein